MLDGQLRTTQPLVVIDVEPVHGGAAPGQGPGCAKHHGVEQAIGTRNLELEVAFSHHTLGDDIELPAKHGSRKTLSPHPLFEQLCQF